MLTEKDLLVGTCAGQCLPSQFELLKRGTRLALGDFEGRHWAQVRKYSEASHTWDRPVQVCQHGPIYNVHQFEATDERSKQLIFH